MHTLPILCFIVLLYKSSSALSLQSGGKQTLSRRDALFRGVASAGAVFLPLANDSAKAETGFLDGNDSSMPPERLDLLQKIAQKASDEQVAQAIAKLELLDPSHGTAATSDKIGGEWELIYSVNAEAFSPLLNLPKPIRPSSYQLIGESATPVVGEGRIAQLLKFPTLPLSLILSSGAVPYEKDPSVLEIFPPFRFEAKLGSSKVQIVESGSDAEFRALNSRTEEAQLAGRNLYRQRYLETSGKKGDLRISEVIAGDPVLVGVVFVHRRL